MASGKGWGDAGVTNEALERVLRFAGLDREAKEDEAATVEAVTEASTALPGCLTGGPELTSRMTRTAFVCPMR